MFISFEGCEAVGKSTQAKRLADYLSSQNENVWLTREPGGTVLAEKIRNILLENEIEDSITEMLLISAARRDHVLQIKQYINSGGIVISDRFSDSSLAYQAYAKGLDITIVKQLISFAINGVLPNITFLLDADLDILLKRKLCNTRHNNFYDNKSIEFYKKVREGFLTIAEESPHRFIIINTNDDIQRTSDNIIQKVIEHRKKICNFT